MLYVPASVGTLSKYQFSISLLKTILTLTAYCRNNQIFILLRILSLYNDFPSARKDLLPPHSSFINSFPSPLEILLPLLLLIIIIIIIIEEKLIFKILFKIV